MPRKLAILFVFFFAVLLALYGHALTFDFVTLDDGILIYQNPAAQGFSWENLVRAFTTYDPELYIPLTLLTYQLDYAIGGTSPVIYHLSNLLWHTGNGVMVAVLVWLLLRSLGERGFFLGVSSGACPLIAIFCGLLFLVHPINTEAAVWASARKDLVSLFFFLLSLVMYIRYVAAESGKLEAGGIHYAMSIAAFGLALLAKVSAVMLPVILVLIDWYTGQRFDKRFMKNKIPYLILAVIFGIVAIYGKAGGRTASPLLGIASIFFSLRKYFFPRDLSVGYPFTGDITLVSPAFILPFLGVLAVCVFIGFCFRRKWNAPVFGLLFFLVTIIPSLFNLSKGLVNYLGADRYVYLPQVGLVFVIGWSLTRVMNGVPALFVSGVAVATLVSLSTMARAQSFTWRDSEALYTNVLRLYPGEVGARVNLGNTYRRQGKLQDALRAYEEAIRIREDPRAFYNWGVVLEDLGRTGEAIAAYERAVALDPAYAIAFVNLGKSYFASGRKEEALAAFRAAVERKPDFSLAHFNLGYVYAERGDFSLAAAEYRTATELDPHYVDARVNLVLALVRAGERAEAQEHADRLLREHPDHEMVRRLRSVLLGR